LEESHASWVSLKDVVKIETLASSKTVKKSYERFLRSFSIGVSMLSRGALYKNRIVRLGAAGIGAVYDFFAKRSTQRKVNLFYANVNFHIISFLIFIA